MRKQINLSNSVYDICKEYPEIIEVMKELGFDSITNTGMLNTAGRFMTIPKGATMKKIPISHIITELEKKGYQILE